MVSTHKDSDSMRIRVDHSSQRLGRPATRENRQVPEDILRAAEACLEKKNPQEVSVKEIATLAGTRSAMIYYYYGSKEGLLAEILRRHVEGILLEFATIKEAILRGEVDNPTRAIIVLLAACFNRRPTLQRILVSEILREDSPLTSFYLERWRSTARVMMVEVITRLAASGYYRPDVKVGGIVAMIRSVVFFPVVAKAHIVQSGESVEQYLDNDWIDFVTEVFDSYLRRRQ